MKMRKCLVVFAVLALVAVAAVLPLATAAAADLSNSLSFITGVSLTDRAGNPLGSDVDKDAEIKLAYTYAIPNDADVRQGDTFVFNVPEQILITVPGGFDLTDDDSGQVIATGVIATDGTLTITFTQYVELYSNIHGEFWFDLEFDEDAIGYDDPAVIVFEVGAQTEPYIITVDFDQPEPPSATAVKSGSYNTATNEITWSVTVNPENLSLHDVSVTDAIANGQTFVPGSVTLNGAPADPANYTHAAGLLTYTFPAPIATQQILTFKVTVDDSQYLFPNAHGATIVQGNTATLRHDGTFVLSNDATVSVPVSFIAKAGSYSSARKQIDWTVTVNRSQVSIPDAVLTDTLPAGLPLDLDSVAVDGVPTMAYTYVHPVITLSLGSIEESRVITFSTDVDPNRYLTNGSTTYTNSATLSGTNVPGNATSTRGIGVTSSLVQKQGISYNRATAEITWRVTLNSNQIALENPVFTDAIRVGQELVSVATPAGWTYDSYVPGDGVTTPGALTLTFAGTTSQTFVFEIKTRVSDPSIYASNATVTYYNTGTIDADNINPSSSTGNRSVSSTVISKTGTAYNHVTREITWQIVVNANAMPLSVVVVSDNIPLGQQYVEGSATINLGASVDGFSYVSADPGDVNKTGTLMYTFDAPITIQYTITFKTVLTDLSIFETNGNKIISNSATLSHELLPGGVSTTGTRTVSNTVVSKFGEYTTGNKYIDWTILLNLNTVPLENAVITDQFQQGLELDTVSVRLFRLIVNPDGSTTTGEEIALGADNVNYDFDTRTLDFHIPTPISGAYMLTFRTIVRDKTKSPFTNQAYFNGTGTVQTGTSAPIAVAWAGSGSSGSGETGSMRVYKVDSEDNEKVLSGCTFELIDRYGNVIQRATTDASGSVLFEWLRFDVDYTVVETVPPEGYLYDSVPYTFRIASADVIKDFEYTFSDEQIVGGIRVYKRDLSLNPVSGAVFTLYNEQDEVVAQQTSDTNGEVLFENVPYGDYTIRETTPPQGYFASSDVLNVSVTEDGVIVDGGSIQNEAMLGSVTLQKTGEDGQTPLPGARIGLYRPGENTPVMETESGPDGEVLFGNVPLGSYVIKEIEAPAGYRRTSREIAVEVTSHGQLADAGILINTVYREHSPDTGDGVMLYILLLCVGIAGMCAVNFAGKAARRRSR
jgi:uncharacterized repeat protein (TIGR01451 family)